MSNDDDYWTQLAESVRRNDGAIPEQRGNEPTEWDARLVRCSRRILSAVVFREMAGVTFEKTDSALLPTVGLYYTLFHAGVAMLCIDHATPLPELSHKTSQMKHSKLRALLESRLVANGLLSRGYLECFDRSKRLREYMNYSVGGRLPGDRDVWELKPDVMSAEVETHLGEAVELLRSIAKRVEIDDVLGLDTIRMKIGDDFGDDLVQMYVPREHRDRVWGCLQGYGITT